MKRPTQVKIIGKVYSITFAPSEHADLRNEFAGRIDHDRQAITIEQGHALEQEQDTVLHEVLHGIERSMDLELEETAIRRIATGLFAVLKDNPSLVAYLMSKPL